MRHVIDEIYESEGEDTFSLLDQIRISLHVLFCSRCYRELKNLESIREIMRSGFFPPAPGIEETVMEKIAADTAVMEDDEEFSAFHRFLYGGFSTRGWIIAGCFMLISLVTAFFGMDFISIARTQGEAFLLPLGLTIGGILTAYGALFIGSHLKELASRFGLR